MLVASDSQARQKRDGPPGPSRNDLQCSTFFVPFFTDNARLFLPIDARHSDAKPQYEEQRACAGINVLTEWQTNDNEGGEWIRGAKDSRCSALLSWLLR
jgi:hypothetical protein